MREFDTTETQRGHRAGGEPEAARTLLWVHPEAGRITKPGRRCVVGRAGTCDVQLHGVELSREHIELTRSGLGLRVRDLGSRNGVWVNGHRVESSLLAGGDMLRLGEWVAFVMRGLTPEAKFSELAPGLFGGPRLAGFFEHARKLVQSGVPVEIEGPAGSGKDCLKRALHAAAARDGASLTSSPEAYSLYLPELAQRREEIAPLFKHFTRDAHGGGPAITSELIEWLCLQPWPQNVRELESLARRMTGSHPEAACLGLEHLPAEVRSPELQPATPAAVCDDAPV